MKNYNKFKVKRFTNKGFTIIEIIMVISIISILSSVLIPTYKRYIENARTAKAISIGQAISSAAIWSFSEQNKFINESRLKSDVESITDIPIQEVAIDYFNNTITLEFSSDDKSYVIELVTSSQKYLIREQGKGTVVYE